MGIMTVDVPGPHITGRASDLRLGGEDHEDDLGGRFVGAGLSALMAYLNDGQRSNLGAWGRRFVRNRLAYIPRRGDLVVAHSYDVEGYKPVKLARPVHTEMSWHARAGQGYDICALTVDWEAQSLTCPAGTTNVTWHSGHERRESMTPSMWTFINITAALVTITSSALLRGCAPPTC